MNRSRNVNDEDYDNGDDDDDNNGDDYVF